MKRKLLKLRKTLLLHGREKSTHISHCSFEQNCVRVIRHGELKCIHAFLLAKDDIMHMSKDEPVPALCERICDKVRFAVGELYVPSDFSGNAEVKTDVDKNSSEATAVHRNLCKVLGPTPIQQYFSSLLTTERPLSVFENEYHFVVHHLVEVFLLPIFTCLVIGHGLLAWSLFSKDQPNGLIVVVVDSAYTILPCVSPVPFLVTLFMKYCNIVCLLAAHQGEIDSKHVPTIRSKLGFMYVYNYTGSLSRICKSKSISRDELCLKYCQTRAHRVLGTWRRRFRETLSHLRLVVKYFVEVLLRANPDSLSFSTSLSSALGTITSLSVIDKEVRCVVPFCDLHVACPLQGLLSTVEYQPEKLFCLTTKLSSQQLSLKHRRLHREQSVSNCSLSSLAPVDSKDPLTPCLETSVSLCNGQKNSKSCGIKFLSDLIWHIYMLIL